MLSRRNFLTGSAMALAGTSTISSRAQAAAIPEAPTTSSPNMQPPLPPAHGQDYQPVVTLNGWTLPWRMNGDWKEFHLVAEEVEREIAPGMTARLWGYNGQTPGPTIELVEGDKVRIFVTNKLPEHTTIHWHGMLLPNGMDGVGGLTQPHIPAGKTFVYEFEIKGSGTFMYHPHSDEMVQMAMGLMGSLVVHPKDPQFRRVDRDFVFIMSSYRFDPGTSLPQVSEMTDFNIWTFNARVFPGIDVMPVRLSDRVRIRMANITMNQSPDPPAWASFRGELHRRRLGAGERATARNDDRRACRRDTCGRSCGGCSGRLGIPLPQVASHDECHGSPGEELHWPGRARSRQGAVPRGAERHGHGHGWHGHDGRDGDASPGEHATNDDRHRIVRAD